MPGYDDYTLSQVEAALQPGDPATLTGAGRAFAGALTALRSLGTGIPAEVRKVTTGPSAWTGPAASAFGEVVDELVAFVDRVAQPLEPYERTLSGCATALATAQSELSIFKTEVEEYRAQVAAIGVLPDDASIDAEARKILERLARAYRGAIGKLRPIPTSPQDDATADEGESNVTGGLPVSVGVTSGVPDGLGPVTFTASAPHSLSSVTVPGVHLANLSALGQPFNGTNDPTVVLAGFTGQAPTVPVVSTAPGTPVVGPGPDTTTGFGLGAVPSTTITGNRSTTRRIPGLGAAATDPTVTPQGDTASLPPPSLLANAGTRGPGGRGPLVASSIGRPGEDDEHERTAPLVGDQDWTDDHGLAEAIGRTPAPRSDR